MVGILVRDNKELVDQITLPILGIGSFAHVAPNFVNDKILQGLMGGIVSFRTVQYIIGVLGLYLTVEQIAYMLK